MKPSSDHDRILDSTFTTPNLQPSDTATEATKKMLGKGDICDVGSVRAN